MTFIIPDKTSRERYLINVYSNLKGKEGVDWVEGHFDKGNNLASHADVLRA